MSDISIPMPPNEVEEKPAYDYKTKMRENREGWSIARVVTISAPVPQDYRDFFRAAAMMVTGQYLLDKVDAHDTDIIEVLANKRPTKTFDPIELLSSITELEALEGTEDQVKEGKRILDLYRQKDLDHRDGEIAAENGDEVALMYHFAREYAIAYYLRGAHDYLQHQIKGGDNPISDL